MNLPLHFCRRSIRQINFVPKHCTSKVQFLSHVERCTKLSAACLSHTALKKPYDDTKEAEQIEVSMIKNLLAGNNLYYEKTPLTNTYQNTANVERRPCTSEKGHCNYKSQLAWQDILLGPEKRDQSLNNTNSNIIGITHEMWYCTNIDDACPKKHIKENCVEFQKSDTVQFSSMKDNPVAEQKTRSVGPSQQQLSLILLRLREELPSFFEGQHRYSIYSKDILFVNKLTRTTTRTLKSYKYIMQLMAYAGRLFWTKASLDILRITKHAEDNTIKVRWTAKGIPWYQLPFFLLSGKPQSLFYRYVDGFSIFEVGRDGLVHCHRIDKVMPTATPERQKWSIRQQVLALLGLGEITHDPCEAFQIKTQEVLK